MEYTVSSTGSAFDSAWHFMTVYVSQTLLYRCYVIWECRKKPLILPALLMVSNLVVTITRIKVHTIERAGGISTIINAATNLALTALTAGRILWIERAASRVALDNTIRGRYRRAVVIILESGAVYFIVAIFLVITGPPGKLSFGIDLGIAEQLLNIIPTFTLVYIGLKNMSDNSSAYLENNIIVFSNGGHLSRSRARPVLHRRSSWPVLDIKLEGPSEDLQDV
ncbi:hypothetical protein K438DRAFT_1944668 [Mycena galopus ATCC 62051]|nr:hypothetical protein K438DRAFT_1944668 [Mycena galopus ATCC 62051]